MADTLEWVAIKDFKPTPIGAIGFIGNKAVAIAAFYDDADGNQDGQVSLVEKISSKLLVDLNGRNIAEVAMAARTNLEVVRRDADFAQQAPRFWLKFGAGLVRQGVYTPYFARGVNMIGSGVARRITNGMVKRLWVRKGFEAAVNNAFKEAVKN